MEERTRSCEGGGCPPAESLAEDVRNASVAGRDSVVGDALIWIALHCQHTKLGLLAGRHRAAVNLAERAALTSGDWPCMAVMHGSLVEKMTTEEWMWESCPPSEVGNFGATEKARDPGNSHATNWTLQCGRQLIGECLELALKLGLFQRLAKVARERLSAGQLRQETGPVESQRVKIWWLLLQ